MWSRSVSSYHLSKQSRWTLEVSWSNKQGFKRQKVLKDVETNKQSYFDRKKKRYNPKPILNKLTMISEPSNHFSAYCKTISLRGNSQLFFRYPLLSYLEPSAGKVLLYSGIFLVQLWLTQHLYRVTQKDVYPWKFQLWLWFKSYLFQITTTHYSVYGRPFTRVSTISVNF